MSIVHGRRTAGLQHPERPHHHADRRVEALAGRRHGPGHRRHRPALDHRRRDAADPHGRLHGRPGPRPRRHHAEPGPGRAEQHARMADMGAASSVVAFFRSMGGSVGRRRAGCRARPPGGRRGRRRRRPDPEGQPGAGAAVRPPEGDVPDLSTLPEPIRAIFETRSATRPATSSWWRCRSRSARWWRCCSSRRCRCAPPWAPSEAVAPEAAVALERDERPRSAPCTPSSRRSGS